MGEWETDRQTGGERGRRRLRDTIRPWVAGFSWFSIVTVKLGQTQLSLCLYRNNPKEGAHTTPLHIQICRQLQFTKSWGHSTRTVWELCNGELWLTWKPDKLTARKCGRYFFDKRTAQHILYYVLSTYSKANKHLSIILYLEVMIVWLRHLMRCHTPY